MAKSGTLRVKILGDSGPLEKSLKGASSKIGAFSKKIAKTGAMAFGAMGAAAVGGAFKVASFGDEVAKSSQKAGLGVEQFQELRFAFGQGGVEATTFDTALQKFNKRLGESATTGGTADDAFDALNVSLRDADGNVRDAGGAMDEILPKLAAVESDAERAALAGDLFGQRAGPELAAALADGVEGIDDARQKAQDLGIVMGEDAAKSAEKFTDQFNDIKQAAGGLLRQGLTPVMATLSEKVFPFIQNTVIPALRDFREWLGPRLKAAASTIGSAFRSDVMPVLEALSDWWATNGPTITRWGEKISDLLSKNWKPVLAGVAAVISAALVPAVAALVGSMAALFSPVTLIIGGIAALAAGLTYAYENFETFRNIVDAVWGWLQEAIPAAIEVIRTGIATFVEWARQAWDKWGADIMAIAEGTWTAVSTVVSETAADVRTAIETFVDIVTTIWDKWGKGIVSFVRTTWNNVSTIVSGALKVVRGIIDTVTAAISGDWSGVWNGIKATFSGVWDTIKGVVSQAINVVRTTLDAVNSTIEGAWSRVWDGIASTFSDAWQGIVGTARTSINTVLGFINRLIGAWNGLELQLPAQTVDLGPLGSHTLGGAAIGTPNLPPVPTLDRGGEVLQTGLAVVHRGERFSGTAGQYPIGDSRPMQIVLEMDGREIARSPAFRDEDERIRSKRMRLTAGA